MLVLFTLVPELVLKEEETKYICEKCKVIQNIIGMPKRSYCTVFEVEKSPSPMNTIS